MPESKNNPMGTYRVGLGNVGSYQVSGAPYITGSTSLVPNAEHCIGFPFVAKSVLVINTDTAGSDDLRVHFNSTSSAGRVIDGLHYVALNENKDSITFNTKCKEIFISAPTGNGGNASYTVVAELTSIQTTSMYALTGSGLTD